MYNLANLSSSLTVKDPEGIGGDGNGNRAGGGGKGGGTGGAVIAGITGGAGRGGGTGGAVIAGTTAGAGRAGMTGGGGKAGGANGLDRKLGLFPKAFCIALETIILVVVLGLKFVSSLGILVEPNFRGTLETPDTAPFPNLSNSSNGFFFRL